MNSESNLPKSPITGNNGVSVFDTFDVNDIIELYKLQENIDVSKYFDGNEEVFLLECEKTGYRFYYPHEIGGDEDFYQTLQLESNKHGLDYDRDLSDDHKFAITQIEKNEKLLEIGCGTGKFLEQISSKTNNAEGLELNSLAAKKAEEKGFTVHTRRIEEFAEENHGSFDVVCAFQVLEHVADVKPFIEAALELIQSNGKLVFSVPNNEPFFQRFSKYEVLNLPPHHMGLWNLGVFKKLCEIYNLEICDHKFTGTSGILVDTYLRAKKIADIKTLPKLVSTSERIKIMLFAPIAGVLSGIDHLRGMKNHGHLTVVIKKF